MLIPLALVGLIVLLPMSVRLAMWGRQRELSRPWMAWLPLAAPVCWVMGTLVTAMFMNGAMSDTQQVPVGHRAQALSDAIAESMQASLAGAIAALAVFVACGVYFTTRPFKRDDEEPSPSGRGAGVRDVVERR